MDDFHNKNSNLLKYLFRYGALFANTGEEEDEDEEKENFYYSLIRLIVSEKVKYIIIILYISFKNDSYRWITK